MNPILALIVANLIWGMASPIFKVSLQNIPPFTLAFIRFFGAGLLMSVLVKDSMWKQITLKNTVIILVGALFGITLNITAFFLALGKTESINAPIIASSSPVFLYLFAILFLRERPKLHIFIGILISGVGVALIIFTPFLFSETISYSSRSEALTGNLLLILATIGSIGHVLIFKTLPMQIDYRVVSFIGFTTASLTFLPGTVLELTQWSIVQLDWRGWMGIIFGVFFSSALAYSLFMYGISKIEAQKVGLFTYIDPISAILIAIPLLGEYPSFIFIIGSIFIFIGIFIAEKRIHWHPFNKIQISNSK